LKYINNINNCKCKVTYCKSNAIYDMIYVIYMILITSCVLITEEDNNENKENDVICNQSVNYTYDMRMRTTGNVG